MNGFNLLVMVKENALVKMLPGIFNNLFFNFFCRKLKIIFFFLEYVYHEFDLKGIHKKIKELILKKELLKND